MKTGTVVKVSGPLVVAEGMRDANMLYLILGLAVTLLVILIMKFLFDRKNKKHSGKTDDMSKEG